MARLIRFAWKKAASTDDAFESTGVCPFNRNRVPEYFFSISDTSGIVTFMETAPADMAPICELSTSGTNSQNVLPVSAGPSLCSLYPTLIYNNSPEEVTPSRLLKIVQYRRYRGNIQLQKSNSFYPSLKKLIIPRKSERIKKEIMSEQRKLESVNSANTSGLQGQKMYKKNSQKIFIIKRHLKILRRNAVHDGKTTCRQLRKMTN
jgi:hypothetical protein